MKKLLAIICVFACFLAMSACTKTENNETSTISGMVISVEGTEIKIVEMNSQNSNRPNGNFNGGNFNPEDFEGFSGNFDPENFNPENFEGGNFDPENLEGFNGGNFNPENFNGQMPEGMPQVPNGQKPEGMPEGMPERTGEPSLSTIPGFSSQMENMETKTFDIKNAHISVEIEDGKAEGSISDITVGSSVTITLDKDGNVTNILVSQGRQMSNKRPTQQTNR